MRWRRSETEDYRYYTPQLPWFELAGFTVVELFLASTFSPDTQKIQAQHLELRRTESKLSEFQVQPEGQALMDV